MMKVQAVLVSKPRKKRPAARGKTRSPQRHARNRLQVLLLCLMVMSLFGGVLLFSLRTSAMESAFRSYYASFEASLGASFSARLFSSLLPGAGVGLMLWYFGLSPAGTTAILPLLAVRCAALGALSVWLVQNGGTAFYFCRLFPAKVLQLLGLFLLAYCACSCCSYLKSRLKQDSFRDSGWFIAYLKAGLPGMGLLVLSALCEVLLQQWLGSSISLSSY